jgi:hypothetical protein
MYTLQWQEREDFFFLLYISDLFKNNSMKFEDCCLLGCDTISLVYH